MPKGLNCASCGHSIDEHPNEGSCQWDSCWCNDYNPLN